MNETPKTVRRCGDCPEWTHTACCFAFGKFWRGKSGNGGGCEHPMDGVAESWRKAGWKPGGKPGKRPALPTGTPPAKNAGRPNPYRQPGLFAPSGQKADEPPPLTDDDY